MQTPQRGSLLILALVLLAAAALIPRLMTESRVRAQRVTATFGDQDYAALAGMLRPPSAVRLLPDGDLEVVDRAGESHRLPAANLPLRIQEVGEDQELLTLTGLGPATNGVLDLPASQVHLRLEDHTWAVVQVEGARP